MKNSTKQSINAFALWLVIIGGANWLLDILNFNIVDAIANAVSQPALATVVYWLVGLSSGWLLFQKLTGNAKISA